MRKRIPIKNHQREIQLIANRVWFALFVFVLLVSCLVARLIYLQVIKQEMYSTLATKNWLDFVPIEPTRGLIYDRNGVLLAENIPVFTLEVVPMQVQDLNAALTDLKTIVNLDDGDIAQFKKQLRQYHRFEQIPLKVRLSEIEVAKFSENQYRFPGFLINARLIRHYPRGEIFSHVLGYVGRINQQELNEIDQTNYSASRYIGKLGIEKFYEEELHGKVGYEEVENDASGKQLRVRHEIKATPGKNIYLTLDAKLQEIAQNALTSTRGAIVVMEPATGQILAMVSKPGYDPNLFVGGISQKQYDILQYSLDRPLFDRALRGTYPPASTIKPFIALRALDEDFISPEDSIFDAGWFSLPNSDHVYHDWVRYGHGRVNLSAAITQSCDTYFYQLGYRMGIHQIDVVLGQFGFGAVTGIDLDDEVPGILASPEWKKQQKGTHWYDGDTVISAIGHGFMQATPLQLASATATLANRGARVMPTILLGEQAPGGELAKNPPLKLDPVTLKHSDSWNLVINAMQNVVDSPRGTAFRYGRHPGYTIAGKTGTAAVTAQRRNANEEDNQDDLPERLRDHHLFIAFAPVDHPTLAIAVVSENSSAAIDATRTIFNYYLGTKTSNDQGSTASQQ